MSYKEKRPFEGLFTFFRLDETRELLLTHDAINADDIIADMLGLEPDYIMDILF